jgi:hypothetical protein
MTPKVSGTLLALALAVGCAACAASPPGAGVAKAPSSAPSASASASPSPSDPDSKDSFVQCMRGKGQIVPANGDIGDAGNKSPAWKAAYRACQRFLPGGPDRQVSGPPPEDIAKLRAFAACMRTHKIEMTDPLPDGNMKIKGRFEHANRAQLQADPVYKAAMAACRDRLPAETKGKG